MVSAAVRCVASCKLRGAWRVGRVLPRCTFTGKDSGFATLPWENNRCDFYARTGAGVKGRSPFAPLAGEAGGKRRECAHSWTLNARSHESNSGDPESGLEYRLIRERRLGFR